MVDLGLASFAKFDCRWARVVLLTVSQEELHTCATCKATVLVKSGGRPRCPAQRLLDYQRSRIASHAANQP